MARKKPPQKSDAPSASEEKLRAVRLEVTEAEHEALRIEAAKQDVSLGELARLAVREYLAAYLAKKPAK